MTNTSADVPLRIYVSHRFAADEEYLRVLEYLDGARRLLYQLVSAPDACPPEGREGQREAWRRQIQAAEVVILLAAHFDLDPEAVAFQARFAATAAKPLLVLRRFGSVLEPLPTLTRGAHAVLDWNARSLADALRRFGRQQEARRWDTIEFTSE